MEKSVPEALFTTDSTEPGSGNAVDTGAASAERRSLRRKARPTTVSNIEELLSMWSSLSESRVSAFPPRFPGSKGLPGTPSPAGSRRQPKCVVDSITEGSPASLPKSFKPTRFARSRAIRRRCQRRPKTAHSWRVKIAHPTIGEISTEEFEAARKDRDDLWRQLEIECWFAELRSAVFAWQEKMLRFAARMHSEETRRFVPIQVECELTSRMAAVLVATHGLRPYIDRHHHNCPRKSACVIAKAMRNSWTHVSVRLLDVTTAGDDLYLTGSQIDHMPTNGHRHRIELRVPAKQLLERAGHPPMKTLEPAIVELFPDGDIDTVTVLNSHVACINKAMKAYRAQRQRPGAYRDELLARYGLVNRDFVKASCGTQEIPLGEPVRPDA